MKLCIPVLEDKGLQSEICPHFGSAAFFLIVDTENGNCRSVANRNQHHEHGQCRPAESIAEEAVEGILIGGIGRGALAKLQAAGFQVFCSTRQTVEDAIAEYRSSGLQVATSADCCGHHGGDGHNCHSGSEASPRAKARGFRQRRALKTRARQSSSPAGRQKESALRAAIHPQA